MIAMLAGKGLYYAVESHDGMNGAIMVRHEAHDGGDEDHDGEDEGQ